MTGDPSRDLIARLTRDLEPVRPIPRLSTLLAGCLGVAAVVGAVVLSMYDTNPDLRASCLQDATYSAVLGGLAFAVVGGCLAALASAVPGRDNVLRAAVGVGVAGLALAVVAPAVAALRAAVPPGVGAGDFMCVLRGVAFAALPATVVLATAGRGWAGRPVHTVALGLLGAGAVGALLVHLTCPKIEPLHVLCTHTSTPLVMAALLTAAVAPLMHRLAR